VKVRIVIVHFLYGGELKVQFLTTSPAVGRNFAGLRADGLPITAASI
jgi:hypothetical protein